MTLLTDANIGSMRIISKFFILNQKKGEMKKKINAKCCCETFFCVSIEILTTNDLIKCPWWFMNERIRIPKRNHLIREFFARRVRGAHSFIVIVKFSNWGEVIWILRGRVFFATTATILLDWNLLPFCFAKSHLFHLFVGYLFQLSCGNESESNPTHTKNRKRDEHF